MQILQLNKIEMKSKGIIVVLILISLVVVSFKLDFFGSERQNEPITLEEFNKHIARKDKAVLVYFRADWCMVCAKMKPVMEDVQKDFDSRMEVYKIDTEKDKEVAEAFEVDALPLLVLYKNGEKRWIHFGAMEKTMLEAEIDRHLKY